MYRWYISQKTPSGKSVFSIVCGETSSDTKEIRDELSVEAPEGNTEAAAEEEAPEEEVRSSWENFIVNHRESYILKDGKWIDLTAKEAYDFILGSGKKYVGDLDI